VRPRRLPGSRSLPSLVMVSREHGGPAAFRTHKIIGTDGPALSRAAFEVAPLKAVEFSAQIDTVVKKVADRLSPLIPGVRVDHYKSEPTLFDGLPAS